MSTNLLGLASPELAVLIQVVLSQLPFSVPLKTKRDWQQFLYLHYLQAEVDSSWMQVEMPCSQAKIEAMLYDSLAQAPCKEIQREGKPYLEQYPIDVADDGVTSAIHCFRNSDSIDPHCHPWRYALSVQLNGNCREERVIDVTNFRKESFSRGVGTVSLLRPTDYHRIILPDSKKVWTLFIAPPSTQGWGFLLPPDDKHRVHVEGQDCPVVSHAVFDRKAIVRSPTEQRDHFLTLPPAREVWITNNEPIATA